jgi:hypothetical protein
MHRVRQDILNPVARRGCFYGVSAPASIDDAFLRHTCEEHERSVLYTARYRYLEFLMALDEEDFPYSYLLYVIAVIMAIGLLVVGAFFFVFR